MTLPKIIKSITLLVAVSFAMAWLGQYLLYHYHIADAICFTSDCQQTTKDVIIGTLFKIVLFSAVYFVFMNPSLAMSPAMEVSILLSCLIVNFMHFANSNAYLCLIPYNILSVYFYYKVKSQLNKPFNLYPFLLQELFLLLLLMCNYVYVDELFVSKGLDREIVMYTGAEKMLSRIFDFVLWAILGLHLLWMVLSLSKRKSLAGGPKGKPAPVPNNHRNGHVQAASNNYRNVNRPVVNQQP
jgi:hypothetical protein